jgi:hypothetical protein
MARRRIVTIHRIVHAFALILMSMSTAAWAQTESGVAGVVKDATGAVMPGVTVEAASPALIEKVRTAVTDSEGQYKVVDLRPGTYTVTFSLPGFSTLKREGIELTASFTATVNAELRVGSVEETITVSGQTPLVDAQNVIQHKELSRDLLDTIPTGKTFSAYASVTPGAILPATFQDVGGNMGNETSTFTIHGTRGGDMRRLIDGMRWNSMEGTNSGTGFYPDSASAQEISLQLGGNSAEYEVGGVQVNIIPKEGGNTFKGYFFGTYTNNRFQSGNLNDNLRARGLSNVNTVDYIWDVSAALGGPIRQDRLWFYTTQRSWGNTNFVAGAYYNADPTAWIYVPDLNRQAIDDNRNRHHNIRLTWQASPKNKINVSFDTQKNCVCHQGITNQFSPEGVVAWIFGPPNYVAQTTWSYPATNKLLFQAGATTLIFDFGIRQTAGVLSADQISVLEASTNFRYRAAADSFRYGNKISDQSNQLFSVSYVTGSHAFKVGFQMMEGWRNHERLPNGSLDYTFLNGAPLSLTEWATPLREVERLKASIGLYGEDRWTIKRLTLNLGLRFDYLNAFVPAQSLDTGPFVPARDFPEVACVPCWKDLDPRVGVAYDLFGSSRTAVKVSFGRYVTGEGTNLASLNNPLNTSVLTTTRTWTDANKNFIPDCNLNSPAANGECGAIDNLNFGKNNPRATSYSSNVLTGYGNRGNNWQASASIQHEVTRGLSANVGYFRTWYGNFLVTNNLALSATDFSPYCVTAPADSRLPGGGGNQICGLFDVNPPGFGQVQNVVTQASAFGTQSEVYTGFDVTLNARFPGGLFFSGGLSNGRTRTDWCYDVNAPQLLPAGAAATTPRISPFCAVTTPWAAQRQVKFFGSYPLPWAGLDASGTFQSLPGIPITASYVATNAQIAPSLGRDLAAGTRGTATIDLIPPGALYENRLYQLDLRLTKTVKVGFTRLKGMFDVYNAFNASSILAINTRYGPAWKTPLQILAGRLAKFGVQVDF